MRMSQGDRKMVQGLWGLYGKSGNGIWGVLSVQDVLENAVEIVVSAGWV